MTLILPPATIGIIGGGQLGMMTIREAQRMGYQTAVWDPDPVCPASRIADHMITAPFNDEKAAARLIECAAVMTYEFENVDPDIVESMQISRDLYPGSSILRISRNRTLEKEELRRRGFPTAEFTTARSAQDIKRAVDSMGLPVVIKSATMGYDGKGQSVLKKRDDMVLQNREPGEYVVEKFLDLSCELSVVAARSGDGTVTTFPVTENIHRDNILHVTFAPARVEGKLHREATALAREVIESFGIVGLLCVEMFVVGEGRILVNELAPRPHNSGHYSLDACSYSQFEALVRTICGLALDNPRLLTPCAMVNILGGHLKNLDIEALHKLPGVKVHWYGKNEARPKRKMGHVTILNSSRKELERIVSVLEEMIAEVEPHQKQTTYQSVS